MLSYGPELRGRCSRSCRMLSILRCLHGYDSWHTYCLCDNDNNKHACIWRDNDDSLFQHGQPHYQWCSRWGINSAKYLLSIRLYTHIIRECCLVLISVDFLSGRVNGMLSIAGRYERRDSVGCSRWNHPNRNLCHGRNSSEQYMQLAQRECLPWLTDTAVCWWQCKCWRTEADSLSGHGICHRGWCGCGSSWRFNAVMQWSGHMLCKALYIMRKL
jgi:hypothetical protein